MTDNDFEDFCNNNVCYFCSHQSEQCFPLCDEYPEQDAIHSLYNAVWLSALAEIAMYDYDEDSSEEQALEKCYSEQEELTEKIIQSLNRSVAA